MTPDEIQALREKHRRSPSPDHELCDGCYYAYPCDIIKVLDAYEALSKVDAEPLVQPNLIQSCDTWLHHPDVTADDRADWYNFCPKCGEKL